MFSKQPKKEGNSSRDVAVSRRGGVRTRGGRLPPISSRDISHVMGSKKVVAPNIPARRAVVKKEPAQGEASPRVKAEPGTDAPRPRKAKVFLQTEGSFLTEGPAARIKRDVAGADIGYSLPRVSRKTAESETKYDAGNIGDVLHSYDAKSFYLKGVGELQPHRFPLLKEKPAIKIKSEPGEDEKVNVKSEFSENYVAPSETESKTSVECLKDLKDDDVLILLKLPSDLPFTGRASARDDVKEEKEDVAAEGCIGKLRLLRSGGAKLVLGDLQLELTEDVPSQPCMEVASLDAADLHVLGRIRCTMGFGPHLNSLLQ